MFEYLKAIYNTLHTTEHITWAPSSSNPVSNIIRGGFPLPLTPFTYSFNVWDYQCTIQRIYLQGDTAFKMTNPSYQLNKRRDLYPNRYGTGNSASVHQSIEITDRSLTLSSVPHSQSKHCVPPTVSLSIVNHYYITNTSKDLPPSRKWQAIQLAYTSPPR